MRRGLDCTINRNTGTFGSPTWNLVDCAKDVTLDLGAVEGDATVRSSGDFQLTAVIMKTAQIDLQLQPDPENAADVADYEAFRDAYDDRTPIEVAIMSDDITEVGADGLRLSVQVTAFKRNEPLNDLVTYDITIKPCRSANPPARMLIDA